MASTEPYPTPENEQEMISFPTVYHGAVINPKDLTSYHAMPNCLIAVSPVGEIEWIVEEVVDSMVQEIMSQKGCLEADVVNLKHGEFIIPGFIDTHTVSVVSRPNADYQVDLINR
jgi:guanine deaminase